VILLDGNIYIMPPHYSLAAKGDPSCCVKIPQPKLFSFANQLQKAYEFPKRRELQALFSWGVGQKHEKESLMGAVTGLDIWPSLPRAGMS